MQLDKILTKLLNTVFLHFAGTNLMGLQPSIKLGTLVADMPAHAAEGDAQQPGSPVLVEKGLGAAEVFRRLGYCEPALFNFDAVVLSL